MLLLWGIWVPLLPASFFHLLPSFPFSPSAFLFAALIEYPLYAKHRSREHPGSKEALVGGGHVCQLDPCLCTGPRC